MTKMKVALWALQPVVTWPILSNLPKSSAVGLPQGLSEDPLRTSIYGNLLRNYWITHNILDVYIGLTETKAFSKLSIRSEWLNCGAKGKTVLLWILTNYQDLYDNTTRKESWKRPVDPKGLFINSVPRTTSKQILTIHDHELILSNPRVILRTAWEITQSKSSPFWMLDLQLISFLIFDSF